MKEAIAIVHKPETCRFEAVIDGHIAYAAYTLNADIFTFAHTVVPTVLGGRGVGTALVRHVLDYAAQHGDHPVRLLILGDDTTNLPLPVRALKPAR